MINRKQNGSRSCGIDVEATGRRIERAMRENGYETGSLAEIMNVSYQAVYRWIRGQVLPEMQNLYLLSLLLDVKIDELIVGTASADKSLARLRRYALAYFRNYRKALHDRKVRSSS